MKKKYFQYFFSILFVKYRTLILTVTDYLPRTAARGGGGETAKIDPPAGSRKGTEHLIHYHYGVPYQPHVICMGYVNRSGLTTVQLNQIGFPRLRKANLFCW